MPCSEEISIEGAGSRIEMPALNDYDSDNLTRYTCFPVFYSFNSCLEHLSNFIKGGQLNSIAQESFTLQLKRRLTTVIGHRIT